MNRNVPSISIRNPSYQNVSPMGKMIAVAGSLKSADFHRIRLTLSNLSNEHKGVHKLWCEAGYLPTDWEHFIEVRGKSIFSLSEDDLGVVVLVLPLTHRKITQKLLAIDHPAGLNRLITRCPSIQVMEVSNFYSYARMMNYTERRPSALFEAFALTAFRENLALSKNRFCFFDVVEDSGRCLGRITFELFDSICPKTCENFYSLCIGFNKKQPKPQSLSYKNSCFTRIIKDGWIQGGDIVNNSGAAGESIYGPYFEDENFVVKHDKPGILGMTNSGKRHTNNSQFYITLGKAEWMDRKFVAFGRVVDGWKNVVLPMVSNPKKNFKISSCGGQSFV